MPSVLMEQVRANHHHPHLLAKSLNEVLQQLHGVVSSLTREEYVRKPVGPIGSSIGAHVRHCLDHLASLFSAVESAALTVDYDRRERGTAIETDRETALDAIAELRSRFTGARIVAKAGIRVRTLASPHEPPVLTMSTVGREIAFVLNHTIHHNAMIAAMIELLGQSTPSCFGMAASTVTHQKANSCAQ